MKTRAINVQLSILKARAGAANVRVENANVYVYSKEHDAFVFFMTLPNLAAYEYEAVSGWEELELELEIADI